MKRITMYCLSMVLFVVLALTGCKSDTGPINPMPAGLWCPAPGAVPSIGNYAFFESDPGEFVGAGQKYLYTESDTKMYISQKKPRSGSFTEDFLGAYVWISVGDWMLEFRSMSSIDKFQIGYYGNVTLRSPGVHAINAEMSLCCDHRAQMGDDCWFVIDNVKYDGDSLKAIDLRFANRSKGGKEMLHGQIHWTR